MKNLDGIFVFYEFDILSLQLKWELYHTWEDKIKICLMKPAIFFY